MNNIFEILILLLKAQSYYIKNFELRKQFFSDPDDGLLPITNTLGFFNIEHIAANVPKTALQQLPESFIAQVKGEKTEHIVLVSKTNTDKIKLELNNKKELLLTKAEFLNDWTGLIIAIAENKKVSKSKFTLKQKLNTLTALNVVLLIILVGVTTKSYIQTSYFLLCLCGLVLAALFIKEKFGQQRLASKFCKINATTSCEGVLTSKSAQITKDLDLSDAVMIYFLFNTISFLIIPNSSVFLVTTLLSIPIIFYSVYQQYAVIKKWCPLCLVVATVLVLQCVLQINALTEFSFSLNEILILTTILILIIASWYSVKPLLIAKQKSDTLEIKNLSFRRNYNLFLPFYNNLETIQTEDDKISQISLGTKNPLIKLTIITNPLCQSCIDAHHIYMSLLEEYKDSIQLNYRFLVPVGDRTNHKTIISERLLQLFLENDRAVFQEAFHDWYNFKSVKKWIKKWSRCENTDYNKLLVDQASWHLKQGINSSPTVLINGKLFPKFYNPKDIRNFIEPLFEQISNDSEV